MPCGDFVSAERYNVERRITRECDRTRFRFSYGPRVLSTNFRSTTTLEFVDEPTLRAIASAGK